MPMGPDPNPNTASAIDPATMARLEHGPLETRRRPEGIWGRRTEQSRLAPLRPHDPPSPVLSGVFFHGMDHGPSFEAAQSRSLRGYPLLHAVRTGLVHRTQLHAPSAAPRVGRPARLPCRGVFHRDPSPPSPSPRRPSPFSPFGSF